MKCDESQKPVEVAASWRFASVRDELQLYASIGKGRAIEVSFAALYESGPTA